MSRRDESPALTLAIQPDRHSHRYNFLLTFHSNFVSQCIAGAYIINWGGRDHEPFNLGIEKANNVYLFTSSVRDKSSVRFDNYSHTTALYSHLITCASSPSRVGIGSKPCWSQQCSRTFSPSHSSIRSSSCFASQSFFFVFFSFSWFFINFFSLISSRIIAHRCSKRGYCSWKESSMLPLLMYLV